MHYMMHKMKVTAMPLATSATTPKVPLGQSNSNKAKLETAQQLSLVMHHIGKLPLAPTPMASSVTRWVTFGPTTTAMNPPVTTTNPTPMAAMTTPTAAMTMVPVSASVEAPTTTHATSHAIEFDKGGQRSSSNYGKFQSCKQWSKWHRALMGNANKHKCEQVLDPSYTPNPNDPDKIAFFGSQQ